MKRLGVVAALVVCLAAGVAFGPVSSAQEPSTTSTTSSVPAGSSTTTTVDPTSTTTTAPEGSTSVPTETTSTLPPGVVPPIDPSVPLPPDGGIPHEDEEFEDPTTGITPKGPWDGVGITNPVLAGLKAQVDLTQNRLVAAQAAVAQAEATLAAAQTDRASIEGAHKEAAERYAAVRDRFTRRVAASYVAAGQPELRLRPGRDLSAEADRVVLPGVVTDSDRVLADDYLEQREQVGERLRTTIEQETASTQALDTARQALVAAEAAATEAERQMAATPAVIPGFVFPVAGPTSFISSFGFCRDGCSRSHQGNDLFARAGTPVVAVEDGWVEKVGTNRLGGLTVWTRGRSGYRYYYAHLRDWAPLVPGQEITAGTVVGTVGNTGNAATTPSHLHFEIHPGNAAAIDPYPILLRAPRVTLTPEQVAAAAGWSLQQATLNQVAPPPPGG
ncbi:M23 family metallopeptidase [Dermatobacter hominis]|uniref:M23 family metallopeptidase n=1 Tax=Dermatobacter hominis TaxID=2884263 RepID=UPI001D11CBEB|nr:M23 family metallopeptidase [Dermatobacter hominis]UDY37304.1 M23 family metallopeptidase [Dermatobacter hominis]